MLCPEKSNVGSRSDSKETADFKVCANVLIHDYICCITSLLCLSIFLYPSLYNVGLGVAVSLLL